MTNPNNAIGTNAAFGGRTSVNAFNDDLGAFTRGILSGWDCVPDVGLTVALGGDGNTRDVAVAVDSAGNRTTINNISQSPVSVTLASAPASNRRIDLIVAYVDNPANGSATETDNPEACGIIPVSGTPAGSPIAPNDTAIRQAITADGANGTTAYYAILAKIEIASGTTGITSDMITAGDDAKLPSKNVDIPIAPKMAVHKNRLINFAVPTTDYEVDSYTIPTSGEYRITISGTFQTASQYHAVYYVVKKNNANLEMFFESFAADFWGSLTYDAVYDFEAGDVIKLFVRDSVGLTATSNTKVLTSIIQVS